MDFNNDGKMDLIVGENNGQVHIYVNMGTESDPYLVDAGYIQVGESDLNVGYYSKPTTCDWNQDGLFDLIVGSGAGNVLLFINDGTPSSPHFSSGEFVEDKGEVLHVVNGSASPFLADMNEDGLPDLILGEYEGDIRFYENKGSYGAPYFSGFKYLACSGKQINLFHYTRPYLVDWNNDGDLDIVAGHYLSTPVLYLNDPEKVPMPDLDVVYTGPGYVPENGGTITFDVTVTNSTGQPITFDFYTTAQMMLVRFWGPIMNYQGITLSPGQQAVRKMHQYVPGFAPTGSYECVVLAGNSADWQFLQRKGFWIYKN